MDALTVFGLVAVTLMLVFYALEDRSPWCVLGFAGACALGSTYGFLQGALPFGLVEGVWTLVALRRWRAAREALALTEQTSSRARPGAPARTARAHARTPDRDPADPA